MKRILFILTAILLLTSCEFEVSHNGDLDGFWQMTEMQRAGEQPVDVRQTAITMGVQFRLMELRYLNGYPVLCRFEHKDNHLRLYDFRYQIHDTSDELIKDVTYMHKYGIYKLDEDFKVETLTSDRMILSSDSARLVFRKY